MVRRAVLSAACLLLAVPTVGSAAPAGCPQLVDPRGDQSAAGDAAADLISVSATSAGAAVTLTVRYDGESAAATPVSGHAYTVDLDDGETALTAQAEVTPTGAGFALYRHAAGAGPASGGTAIGRPTGRSDPSAHTVSMTIPFALAPDILRSGHRVALSGQAWTAVVTPDVPVTGRIFWIEGTDASDTQASYRLGLKGC